MPVAWVAGFGEAFMNKTTLFAFWCGSFFATGVHLVRAGHAVTGAAAMLVMGVLGVFLVLRKR
jgi:hypothetical protein